MRCEGVLDEVADGNSIIKQQNVELWQLTNRNHMNDQFTELRSINVL